MSAPPANSTGVCADCGAALPDGHPGAVCRACLWGSADETFGAEASPPASAPASGMLALRIPGHDVEAEIARGGMGIVYRAWEREAERHVALKMLLPHLADEPGMRDRFRLEARSVAALDHQAVLPVYHIGVADDVPYFTMKLADGGSLLERRNCYVGRWREIAALLASLADAVHFAHSHGVLHRDLKPGNVLFDESGRPYLSDFGLVKIVDSESNLTRSRHFLGTPHYAAPEVAASSASEATVSSDVWSLGAMLYELLAGRLPFDAAGVPALLRKIVDEPAPALPNEVPRDLAVICLKCLQKLPKHRFASAAALADDLRRWLEGRSVSARPMSRAERLWAWARRNPGVAGLGAGLFAALAITALSLWRENSANVRALDRSREAETVSRKAEGDARMAQAASLLDEARAIRRGGRILERQLAVDAVLRSYALRPSAGARDELASILATPKLEVIGSVPYTRSRAPYLDGKLERYAAFEDGIVSVRDRATQRVLWQLPQVPTAGFQPGPLSPNGRLLAIREAERTTIWEEGKSEPVLVLQPPVRGLPLFSAGGRFFTIGGSSTPLLNCDFGVTPPAVRTLMDGATGWYPGAFSPDQQQLAVVDLDEFGLRILDTATGNIVRECAAGRRLETKSTGIQSIAWSASGSFLVAGTLDGKVARWSMDDPLPDWTMPAHAGAVDALAIVADDRLLVTQGRDGLVKFTSLLTLDPLGTAPWPGVALTPSADGTRLAIDRLDAARMELLSCEVPSAAEVNTLPPSRDSNLYEIGRRGSRVIAWPDGSKFTVSPGLDAHDFDGNSVLRPLSTEMIGRLTGVVRDFPSGRWLCRYGELILVLPPPLPLFREPPSFELTRMADASLAYDPHSRRVFLGHKHGFSLYNFSQQGEGIKPKRESVKPLKLPGDRDVAVSAVAWSPDGKLVAWAGTDTRELDDYTKAPPPFRGQPALHVFDPAAGGAEKLALALPAAPHALLFVPNEAAVIAADALSVTCYDIPAARQRWRHPHRRTSREPVQLAAARDAGTVAVTFDPQSIALIDPATGVATLTLTHPLERTVRAMDIIPDGTRLLALAGNLVQLWRLEVLRAELERHLPGASR